MIVLFAKFLSNQIKLHKSFRPADAAKMCYQAANGVTHIINESSRNAFFEEYEKAKGEAPLFEEIGGGFVRVNLAAWKEKGLNPEWLYRLFAKTAHAQTENNLEERLKAVTDLAQKGETPFSLEEWQEFLREYDRNSISHSAEYKKENCPSYRVIKKDYVNLFPIFQKIIKIDNTPTIIAIDGNAASGKTTLCKLLCEVLSAKSVQMDHFFLPLSKRTPSRLKEVGGNIDYERFCDEVLPYIREDFEYTHYDCSKLDFSGKSKIKSGNYLIVEGSYSHHPKFNDYADVKLFCRVGEAEQLRRIIKRDGEMLAKRFENEWIPMENAYFSKFSIKEKADMIFDGEN